MRKRIISNAQLLASFAVVILVAIFLTSCTSDTSKPAETQPEPKKTELLTGRSAFQKMFIAARGWARDAQPYLLESVPTSDANGHDGKSAEWRSNFASASQRAVKSYLWSGSIAPDAPSTGISPGTEDSYNPSNASTQVFDIAFLKVDSDQAFTVAQKHGGDKILEKAADTPVIYACDWNRNTNRLVWHVIYGSNRETAKLTISIDASTGEFIRVEK